MNHRRPPSLSLSRLQPRHPVQRPSVGDIDAQIAQASDDDLEMALRLVAWNARDLGQFLKQRRVR